MPSNNNPSQQSNQGDTQGNSKNTGNFASDRERASSAGQKGGQASGGNFANDTQRAAEAGRKGGQSSQSGSRNNADTDNAEKNKNDTKE